MGGVPPNDFKAEQEVLGAMLQHDGGREAIASVRSILSPEDFYHSGHRRIYEAILEIVDNDGEVTDFLSPAYQRLNDIRIEGYSVPEYLIYLYQGTPTSANATYYAKKVKDCARLRHIIRLSRDVYEKAFNADMEGRSPEELIVELQKMFIDDSVVREITGNIPSVMDDWLDFYEDLCNPQSELIGLRTGIKKLDQITLGLRGLSVLGGMPGQGKTSLALQLASEIAKLDRVPVLFYALEMTKWDLYYKLISRLSGLDYPTLRVGSVINGKRGIGLSKEDHAKLQSAIKEFTKYAEFITIITPVESPISLPMIQLQIEQAKRKNRKDQVFVVIDHLQIFPYEAEDLKAKIDALVTNFKTISDKHNAAVMLISEVNRSSYEQKDWIGAYMGSAGIEYGVDLAILLYNEDKDKDAKERIITLNVVKNRFGEKGDINLKFYADCSNFEEI